MLPVPPLGYGGIERIVAGLVREYRKLGHTVALLSKAGSACEADARFAWPSEQMRSLSGTVRNAFALRRAVRSFRPDLVHSFSRLAYLSVILPGGAAKVMSYQREVGARQVRTARRLAQGSLRFTGCSEFICAQGRRGGGAWRAIPNFVNVERYTFVARVPDDAPLVFLSRIESIKGPHLAIAIARRAGRRLILAGNRMTSGPEAAYFDLQIAPHLGKNGIEWIGEVDDAQKNVLLGSAAALVVPVQWDEPFGIVFVEAMATGTPVLACSRGALPEIVEPGRTGYFVTDEQDGAVAVGRLRFLDRAACRAVVEAQFSASVCAEQYLSLYQQMLDPAARHGV